MCGCKKNGAYNLISCMHRPEICILQKMWLDFFAYNIFKGPPKILTVTNYTISEQGQVAVLSCSVSSVGDDLKVRVNWTTDTNNILKGKQYYMFREGNVFSLLIYNSSAGEYKCKTFSMYSPKEPEDTKTLAVIMKG